MKFKCNGCDKPIEAPRPFVGPTKFKCPSCGMKYTQVIIRKITED